MDVKEYVSKYVALSKPIPFCGLKIKPIKVRDSMEFLEAGALFQFEKNKIPDLEIIKMTYLDFLFKKILPSKDYLNEFMKILNMCLSVEEDEDCFNTLYPRGYIYIDGEFARVNGYNVFFMQEEESIAMVVDNKKISWRDFDEFREIIMFQNLRDYDNVQMSDDVKEALDEYYKIKNKDIIPPDMGYKISVVMMKSSFSEDQVLDMTFYRFQEIFDLILEEQDYTISKLAEYMGNKFEKKIEHWVFKKKKDKYADAFVSADGYKNKIQQAGAN
ncbi:MAG: hypothetical protein ACRCX2_39290 [Paraclostridium sp.]